MAKKPSLIDLSAVDLTHLIADQEEVRSKNLQRFEMEMLNGILYEDLENGIGVGFQDVPENPFWARGHMPGYPIMPGVLICESAAQLASYFAGRLKCLNSGFIGFGGMDNVRFRGPVRPGDKLILVVKLLKSKPNVMMILQFEAIVNGEVIADGEIRGVPLHDGTQVK
ncbi:MAG: beta-hydroxyacyl-ACP dehydratase [Planctomycetaceae bacterium]|nr:beta-hydroxyacyl-ACP dehydratase [Planctomycetaceae bacterium]MBQ2820659.1 beta-hydroxyacyl-ACP dehydratase [Thermoguttaceae bacterium]MDO4424253.1 3-hydroxyacyl-ACP dehydratase FabZ family protein [Planctomycetia bacterium]